VTEIYNKFLKLPLVTLSPEELFTISPVISWSNNSETSSNGNCIC
jgi:hypothetical protein